MRQTPFIALCAAVVLAPSPTSAVESKELAFDVSIYGLAIGMSGELGVGPVSADIDIGLDDVLNNFDFGFMGSVRVGYGPWAITAEVLYMGVSGSQGSIDAELDQWLVEPIISYRASKYVEPLVGARYNSLWAELSGPGVLPEPRIASGTQEWWDPIAGANLGLPLGRGFSLNLRGDVGGFGVGSDLTWQVFPYIGWQFARWGSLQLGYRWLYMDYETGTGASRFEYDILNHGAQLGITFHF